MQCSSGILLHISRLFPTAIFKFYKFPLYLLDEFMSFGRHYNCLDIIFFFILSFDRGVTHYYLLVMVRIEIPDRIGDFLKYKFVWTFAEGINSLFQLSPSEVLVRILFTSGG